MTKNNCPRCHQEKAIIHPQFGIMQGEKCRAKDRKLIGKLTTPSEFSNASQADRIQMDRLKHAGDIEQPWTYDNKPNENFVKLYPGRAKDFFSEEQLKAL